MLVLSAYKCRFATLKSISRYVLLCISALLGCLAANCSFAQMSTTGFLQVKPDVASQISEYIPSLCEDTKGNLWIGCMGAGVCRYDGKKIAYFSTEHGMGGATVRAIAEDQLGNIWLGTEGGLTRWDGHQFQNFTTQNGLPHNEIWRICIDKDNGIWVATLGGIAHCKLPVSGKATIHFTTFYVPPAAKKDYTTGALSSLLVLGIMQDRAGNMWFATNGGGAYKYDGKNLSNFSEKNGLTNDFIQCILEDKKGYIWFITRHGGACRYNPLSKRLLFDTFGIKNGLCTNECWNGLVDKQGNVWITTQGCGIARYDGQTFANFRENNGITHNHIQCLTQDSKGTIWLGFSGGLFCLRNNTIINVTKNGPWR